MKEEFGEISYKVKNTGEVQWPEGTKLFMMRDGEVKGQIKMKGPVYKGESRRFKIRKEILNEV